MGTVMKVYEILFVGYKLIDVGKCGEKLVLFILARMKKINLAEAQ